MMRFALFLMVASGFCVVGDRADGQTNRSWLAMGYPMEWSDEDVMTRCLTRITNEVATVFSARPLATATKSLGPEHVVGGIVFARNEEAIALCDVDFVGLGRTKVLLYLVRSLREEALPSNRVWHTYTYASTNAEWVGRNVDAHVVSAFIKTTNFGMNECDPKMKELEIRIQDSVLVSFADMRAAIPGDEALQERLSGFRELYNEEREAIRASP